MKKVLLLIIAIILLLILSGCVSMDIPSTATATAKGYENYVYSVKARAAEKKREDKYHEKERKRIQKLQAEDVYGYN